MNREVYTLQEHITISYRKEEECATSQESRKKSIKLIREEVVYNIRTFPCIFEKMTI